MNAIEAARATLGTPFVHQGRVPGRALDCAGVIVVVAKTLGFVPEEPSAYSRFPHDSMLESWVERQPFIRRVDKATMRAGDVLLMRFGGEPQHLALCAGETMIHAYQAVGRVVEHGMDTKWRRRIVRVYRFGDSA